METAHLHEFAKVADCGSFTAAARELHLTQSTLSKHVALLEREFGADLFVRDRSGVSLTEAGGVLYAQARQMEKLLRATELLVRAARDGQAAGSTAGVAAHRPRALARTLPCRPEQAHGKPRVRGFPLREGGLARVVLTLRRGRAWRRCGRRWRCGPR